VVDADHRGLIDIRVFDKPVLDFDGVDVLAAPDDHVPAPAFQEEQAAGDPPVVARRAGCRTGSTWTVA
jgi:hypothetical protein